MCIVLENTSGRYLAHICSTESVHMIADRGAHLITLSRGSAESQCSQLVRKQMS